MENAIELVNVSKKFRLYRDRPQTLKEAVVRWNRKEYKEFFALRNVSMKIKKGSTVGIIGKNGSGKSTLLKIINRTMYPDGGAVKVTGAVASLIELGAGFHPELSGRENIYINASIFGLTGKEIRERLPAVVDFAELAAFIDNPVRTYSSGMYARLGFAVAIHVDADILLIDEILGVGDMNFQEKCAAKIFELHRAGKTMIIVSHVMPAIGSLCDYAFWLERGELRAEGAPESVKRQYAMFMRQDAGKPAPENRAEENC
ncbi:MAG: ABC transporter ATP-binding protein [Acidaminococcales bacterium]|nr:ABC transporter ATP-binding protein [Acidaminococcales bacterium]